MSVQSRAEVLARLTSLGIIDAQRAAALGGLAPAPWWLAILQGIAGWIASLFIVTSFMAPMLVFMVGDVPVGRAVAGLVLLGAAIWVFGRKKLFTDQMGLAFSLAGQALVVSAFVGDFDSVSLNQNTLAAIGLLLAAGMMVPPSTSLHRVVCALSIWVNLGVLIGPGNPMLAYAVLLTGGAAAAWLTRERWVNLPWAGQFAAVVHAATLGALVSAWGVGSEFIREIAQPATPLIYQGGVALVLVAAAAWLTRGVEASLRFTVLAGAVLLSAAAWKAPGLVASAAILLAVFHACHRPWSVLALLATAFYLGDFYYSLEATLLLKSGALAATGLVLLALRFALRRWQEASP